jgi:hypothetical protein
MKSLNINGHELDRIHLYLDDLASCDKITNSSYEARVLHFRKSTDTSMYQVMVRVRYFLGTHQWRTYIFIFHFAMGTRVILLWYVRGTPVVLESKKNVNFFFLFFLFVFYNYRKIYVSYLFII